MREGWEYKKLGEVCSPKKEIKRASKVFAPNDTIKYIDISSIDNSTQRMTSCSNFIMSDAPSRAQQCVIKGDVIVSTVRPNLKNIAIVDSDDNNLVASSGFCVLRPCNIERDYLFHYIKSDKFTNQIMGLTTGANYPAVRSSDILESTIPVPPLSTQLSIVSELDKINELIRLKKEQLKDYDNLAQSIFYEMFGDPVVNEKGWIVKTIGDVCSLKSGDSKANKSPKGTLPYVKVGDMNLPGNENYITCSSTYVDRDYNKRGIFPIGSILFPKRGGAILTNKKRMAAVEICCDLNTMGVIPSEVLNKHYLFQWFKILDLGTICSGSTILQLNNCDIAPLLIQIPPLTLQQTFAKRIELIEQQKAEIQSTIADLETLLASRMQYWFD